MATPEVVVVVVVAVVDEPGVGTTTDGADATLVAGTDNPGDPNMPGIIMLGMPLREGYAM